MRTLKSTEYLEGVDIDVAFSGVCLVFSMLSASATVGTAMTALEVPPAALGTAKLFTQYWVERASTIIKL